MFLTANMDSMGDSEFILTLFSAMAQEESNNLSKRVKWGKKINAEKGRVPQRIFGYDRIDNFTLEINPDEARIVRKIFSLYNEQGLGCRTISMELNRDQDKTKFGNDWNARGVRRVLVNPIYCGMLVNHKYEIEDFLTGKQINIPKEEQFSHERPSWAIIAPDTFQKAQEIMESQIRFRRALQGSQVQFQTHLLHPYQMCALRTILYQKKLYLCKHTCILAVCYQRSIYCGKMRQPNLSGRTGTADGTSGILCISDWG